MNEQQLKAQSDILVPPSVAPSMGSLDERVRVRRRRRVVARTIATAAAALAVCGGSYLFLSSRDSTQNQIASQDPSMEGSVATSALADVNPGASEVPESLPETAILAEDKPRKRPRIQLYARISQPLPVFDLDRDTQSIQHVGWVDSEQSLPLDMKYVPDSKLKPFDAVLSGDAKMDGDVWKVSL